MVPVHRNVWVSLWSYVIPTFFVQLWKTIFVKIMTNIFLFETKTKIDSQ
jgi:hypothetical protein